MASRAVTLGLLLSLTAGPAHGQTTVLLRDGLQGYAGTRDVSLINPYANTNPDLNYGTNTSLQGDGFPEKLRSLVRFDLSAIPAGRVVTSVLLTVVVAQLSTSDYQLVPLSQDWAENEVTWNVRRTGTPWGLPGASANADVGPEVLATFRPGPLGPVTMMFTPAGVAVVQRWLDSAPTNQGFLIRPVNPNATDGYRLRSSDDASAPNRPLLVIVTQGGTTYQFQDGLFPNATYSGTADSFIGFGPPYASMNGQGLQVWGPSTGERASSLLRFDLTGFVPTGAQITAASLMLTATNGHPGGGQTFGVTPPWDEARATWLTPDGVATWNTPGADSTIDHGARLGTLPAVANGQAFTVLLNDAGVALVQTWVDGQPNHGFFLVSTVGNERFAVHDREDAVVGNRPALSVTFLSDAGTPSCDGGPCAQVCDGGACATPQPWVLTVGCGCLSTVEARAPFAVLLWVLARRRRATLTR